MRRGRVVEDAADDGVAAAGRTSRVVVGKQRVVIHARAGGRLAEAVGVAAAPAEVGAGRAPVDLLPGVLADVVDEDRPGARLHRERERVAQAECVDELVNAGGGPDERVVGRNQMPDRRVVPRRYTRY